MANINKIGPVGLIPHRQAPWFDRWVRDGVLDGIEKIYETRVCQNYLKIFQSVDRGAGELLKSAAALVDARTYLEMAGLTRDKITYLLRPDRRPFSKELPNLHAWLFHPHAEYEKVVSAAEETWLNPAFWFDRPLEAFDSLVAAAGQSVIPGAMLAFGFRYQIANGMTVQELASNTKAMVRDAVERAGDWILPLSEPVAATPSGLTMRVPLAAAPPGSAPLRKSATKRRKNWRGGLKPRWTDEQIAKVLKRHKGDPVAAARELGYKPDTVRDKLFDAREGSPLYPYRNYPRTPSNRVRFGAAGAADQEIAAVLKKHNGDRLAAAEVLDMRVERLTDRIRGAPKGSELASFKRPPGWAPRSSKTRNPAPEAPSPVVDTSVAARMKELAWITYRDENEVILGWLRQGMSPKEIVGRPYIGSSEEGIVLRLESAPDGDPLVRYARPYAPRRVSDRRMAAALKKSGGKIRAAARRLSISFDVIETRLGLVNENSPLWSYRP